jgi:glycosyltransferase involved in cell wall biosynthesis
MKVCLIESNVNPPWIEGVRNSIYLHSKKLVELNIEPIILTGLYRGLKAKEKIEGVTFNRIPVVSLTPRNNTGLYKSRIEGIIFTRMFHLKLWVWRKLEELDNKYGFDIIHWFGHLDVLINVSRSLCKRNIRKPFVLTLYGLFNSSPPFLRQLFRRFGHLYDFIICNDYEWCRFLDELGTPNAYVPDGIDVEKFKLYESSLRKKLDLKEDDLIILYFGSAKRLKGIDKLFEGIRKIIKVKLILSIDDQVPTKYYPFIKKFKNDVKILPIFSDLPKLISISDIVIFPYIPIQRAQPLSVLEAMACQKPIVTFETKNLVDMIRDGNEGFLVEAWNYKKVAENVINLLSNEELRRRMGKRAREKVVKEYNINFISRKVKDIYEKLV